MAQYYTTPITIDTPIGNNAFSFGARQHTGSPCTITVPALIFGELSDVVPGTNIVFEEITSTGLLHSCIGLSHLVKTSLLGTHIPTYIMDNHNHALYFWYREYIAGEDKKPYTLLHIDQHADLEIPSAPLDSAQLHNLHYIAHYANEVCHVGSFIQPAITSGLLQDVIQIRSVSKLSDIAGSPLPDRYILDIDIDFRVSHLPTQEEIDNIRYLYSNADMCTIALSPYFMQLEDSIKVLHRLFL